MDTTAPQLWMIEYGEYSDSGWHPLVFAADFDMKIAAFAFHAEVFKEGQPQPYKVDADLSGFLVSRYGGRDPDKDEVVRYMGVIGDPVHYGSWAAHGEPWKSLGLVRY